MKLDYIYKAIEKDLEERTVKHPVTERARNIGKTGKWDKYTDPISGEEMDEISYWDGTKIRFLGGVAEIVSPDGETIKYEGNDRVGFYTEGYELFENDQGSEVSKINDNGDKKAHELICSEFLDEKYDGEIKAGTPDFIRELHDKRQIKGDDLSSDDLFEPITTFENRIPDADIGEDTRFLNEHLEPSAINFEQMCKDNHFDSSFITLDAVKETPDLTKRIITNDDWKTEMNLANDEALVPTERGEYTGDGWTIINMRESTNPANCGIDLSIPCSESYAFPGNPNGYFLTAPGQKSERYIIDEENKIIVQRPYKAGMEGHY